MSTPSCSIKGIFCRFRLWSSSASYHQLRCSPLLPEREELRGGSFTWRKRRSLVPVVTGRGGEIFLVDPHILEHWLFQDLLRKGGRDREECPEWDRDGLLLDWGSNGKRKHEQGTPRPICLNCDAILFEFFLWLVENDDPSLRDLNLGDLMEFYGAES
eukprot:c22867_g1_i1 orf=413-886(+)